MSLPIDARVAVVLKGWPRLSETFIAQELAGLEARGVALEIWSLRRPTDKHRHPVHDRIAGRVVYLLYADNGAEPLAPSALAALGALCDQACSTWSRLIAECTRRHC